MQLATLQVSIYHSKKVAFDQFTDWCSVRRAVIFFQKRACESIGWALLVQQKIDHSLRFYILMAKFVDSPSHQKCTDESIQMKKVRTSLKRFRSRSYRGPQTIVDLWICCVQESYLTPHRSCEDIVHVLKLAVVWSRTPYFRQAILGDRQDAKDLVHYSIELLSENVVDENKQLIIEFVWNLTPIDPDLIHYSTHTLIISSLIWLAYRGGWLIQVHRSVWVFTSSIFCFCSAVDHRTWPPPNNYVRSSFEKEEEIRGTRSDLFNLQSASELDRWQPREWEENKGERTNTILDFFLLQQTVKTETQVIGALFFVPSSINKFISRLLNEDWINESQKKKKEKHHSGKSRHSTGTMNWKTHWTSSFFSIDWTTHLVREANPCF